LHGESIYNAQQKSNDNWSDFDPAIILYKDLKNCCEEGPNKSKESMSSELTTVTESKQSTMSDGLLKIAKINSQIKPRNVVE
jgi:hypothetical protein